MNRFLMQALLKWQKKETRSPLLIRGARQVGKTFLVESFGKSQFENFLTINFEFKPECRAPFEQSLDPKIILRGLELITQSKIIPGQCLLFLDEIQECPKAIQALRYFKEQMPELHVIAAGSLLEFVLNEADFSMPVGRVEFLYLKPLSFQEFLVSSGHVELKNFISQVTLADVFPHQFHQQLLKLVAEFVAIGGMPAVVSSYLNAPDFEECQRIQSALLQTYQNDFSKYAHKTDYQNLKNIFSKLPSVVSQSFKYSDVDRELRPEAIKKSLKNLTFAGLVTPVYWTSAGGLPLSNYQLEKRFKLLFLDVGLVARAQYLPINSLIHQNASIQSRGQLIEQFVGQELLVNQPIYEPAELHYWQREKSGSQAEVDYVIAIKGKIIPIEVKAGHSYWLKSLKMLMTERNLSMGVRISEHPFGYSEGILSLPLYMISELSRFI
jgi:predicted AAA+ superfamily ATPase